jgi:hypothetical protein
MEDCYTIIYFVVFVFVVIVVILCCSSVLRFVFVNVLYMCVSADFVIRTSAAAPAR